MSLSTTPESKKNSEQFRLPVDPGQLRIILEGISDAILVHSAQEGALVYANEAAARFLDRPSVESVYRDAAEPQAAELRKQWEFTDENGQALAYDQTPGPLAFQGITVPPTTMRFRLSKGLPEKWIVAQATPIKDESGAVQFVVQIIRDITESRDSEEQLRQSQKMEAVGRLAGGIAHDFNNLLTAINGYSEIALARTAAGDPDLHASLIEIREAGKRAAALTHQLLAFSRKQILMPRLIDINEVVGRMDAMLRRLIGEDITFITTAGAELPKVRADVSQLEQVIINLAVNARDAMPTGGRLILETSLVMKDGGLPGGHAAGHKSANLDPYVMLSVSDTGIGMEEGIKAKIFEPFFTTKDVGKGTGLGLATVYGIVKQSGGSIEVESGLGKGSNFKVYFPVSRNGEVRPDKVQPEPPAARGGTAEEIILLVEDDEAVRNLVCKILADHGYTCLAVENGEQALSLGQNHSGSIKLLLTDVILKGMSGRLLAEKMRFLRPSLRVLYMSGYTDAAILQHGVLEQGMEFINKPFSLQDLLGKIGSILKA